MPLAQKSHNKKFKGPEKVKKFLKANQIPFQQEKRFSECKRDRPLPFDFYIKLRNKEICIECDGKQHFERNNFYNKTQKGGFKYRIENDSIKNKFCENENISLIRIRSDDPNILSVLQEKLTSICKSDKTIIMYINYWKNNYYTTIR